MLHPPNHPQLPEREDKGTWDFWCTQGLIVRPSRPNCMWQTKQPDEGQAGVRKTRSAHRNSLAVLCNLQTSFPRVTVARGGAVLLLHAQDCRFGKERGPPSITPNPFPRTCALISTSPSKLTTNSHHVVSVMAKLKARLLISRLLLIGQYAAHRLNGSMGSRLPGEMTGLSATLKQQHASGAGAKRCSLSPGRWSLDSALLASAKHPISLSGIFLETLIGGREGSLISRYQTGRCTAAPNTCRGTPTICRDAPVETRPRPVAVGVLAYLVPPVLGRYKEAKTLFPSSISLRHCSLIMSCWKRHHATRAVDSASEVLPLIGGRW
jgi:hypothetical protein